MSPTASPWVITCARPSDVFDCPLPSLSVTDHRFIAEWDPVPVDVKWMEYSAGGATEVGKEALLPGSDGASALSYQAPRFVARTPEIAKVFDLPLS